MKYSRLWLNRKFQQTQNSRAPWIFPHLYGRLGPLYSGISNYCQIGSPLRFKLTVTPLGTGLQDCLLNATSPLLIPATNCWLLWGFSLLRVYFWYRIQYIIFKASSTQHTAWRGAFVKECMNYIEMNWLGLFISIPKSKCFQRNLLEGTRWLPPNMSTFSITHNLFRLSQKD